MTSARLGKDESFFAGTEPPSRNARVHWIFVVELGETPSGVPLVFDRAAYQADAVVAINRVKPHTGFSGDVESGLLKMLVVGFGKHRGATTIHRYGFEALPRLIVEAARCIIERTPVALGIALLEDGYGRLCEIRALSPEELEKGEKELLREAKTLLPRIPFPEVDLLVVDEMGKNISGTGIDTNVVGRRKPAGTEIGYILVRDLTPQSRGNAAGIGLADIITARLFAKIDFSATYSNCSAAHSIEDAKIPLVLPNDETAIKTALMLINKDPQDVRVVRIANTSRLACMHVSEALIAEASALPTLTVVSQPFHYWFDAHGNLNGFPLEPPSEAWRLNQAASPDSCCG